MRIRAVNGRFQAITDGVDGSRSRHPGAKVVVVINHEQ